MTFDKQIDSLPADWRILVAEDNPLNRRIAISLVERLGCRADAAVDGREAVRLHDAMPYDLVLMDCRMPHMDGYQAAMHIRSRETSARRTPIVGLTASSEDDARLRCEAAGMDDFIAKPLHLPRLREVFDRWLGGMRVNAATAGGGDELDAMHAVFGADFAELAMLYRRDSPPRIRLMKEAAAVGDHLRLAETAHVFCGSCISIGATRLSALCRRLEQRARNGGADDIGELIGAIENEYDRICVRLQTFEV